MWTALESAAMITGAWPGRLSVALVIAALLSAGCGEDKPKQLDEVLARKEAIARLTSRYGTKKYSEQVEELVVRDYFGDERGGVFLDVGAGDAFQGSTTAYLELFLGWRGIAVDADQTHSESYVASRPGTRFFSFFAGQTDDSKVQFHRNLDRWGSSSQSLEAATKLGGKVETIEVPTITLNTLLERTGTRRIDFLSMDIEGSEPAALAGFDIERYGPRLACIEFHPPGVPAIDEYMRAHGYSRLARYSTVDFANAWYAPAAK